MVAADAVKAMNFVKIMLKIWKGDNRFLDVEGVLVTAMERMGQDGQFQETGGRKIGGEEISELSLEDFQPFQATLLPFMLYLFAIVRFTVSSVRAHRAFIRFSKAIELKNSSTKVVEFLEIR
jgi:hypothetical protein